MTISHERVAENIFEILWEEFEGEHPGYNYLMDAIEEQAREIYDDEGVKLSEDSLNIIILEIETIWEDAENHRSIRYA